MHFQQTTTSAMDRSFQILPTSQAPTHIQDMSRVMTTENERGNEGTAAINCDDESNRHSLLQTIQMQDQYEQEGLPMTAGTDQ